MPPFAAGTAWTRARSQGQLTGLIEQELRVIPGQKLSFSQPIELRFNELIGGVRGDVAVKIYGDDLDKMTATGTRIAAALSSTPGAADVKVVPNVYWSPTGWPLRYT